MPAENTPMKAQYNAIKAEHADCLLFFRLGDFYEMFDEDAVVGSRELDLALTTRDRGKSEEEQRAAARKFFDRFNKPGKFTMLSSHMSSAPKAYLDEIYRYSRVRYAEW